ncbi:HPr family phosphocarrier protein [Shewanella yunxiaonensis]|uniref:HPr family phosphocarrier protein n=1 Tax=Shewanella yunxiaonensis TaxID=2829809 RepID=A0ABX7YV04_9GAMM|nr:MULTISPECIES: HPr family phosphocarrier protein [Shewanella]MDF0533030.1 HPr family phosphocarrier protein [Shewanella sp. A32]QUN06323.1 HPr family phosphocarrier protein [Shewanella yunxiaonensis]
MPRIEREVTIQNKLGLHARAATKLAVLANEFDANILLVQGQKQASAASVLGLLMLETGMGKTIRLIVDGPDAEPAMEAICNLINSRFDEAS